MMHRKVTMRGEMATRHTCRARGRCVVGKVHPPCVDFFEAREVRKLKNGRATESIGECTHVRQTVMTARNFTSLKAMAG